MNLYELLRSLGLSDQAAETAEFLLVRPLGIALLLVAAWVATRLATRGVQRALLGLNRRTPPPVYSPRAERRLTTIAQVLCGLVRTVIWAVAGLLVLDQLGLNLAPLLAGAGVAGVAVGLGAQSMVRDFLSGMFILVEDQYGVGDLVCVGNTTGTVEDVNLRVTRVRGTDGTVWHVPNGDIRTVGNASREWAQALIDVPVSLDADEHEVARVMSEEVAAFASDPVWGESLLEPPELLGMESLAVDHRVMRVEVKTPPRQQSRVARALRARIGARLRQEGLQATPSQSVSSG